jgi:hypothetical protein
VFDWVSGELERRSALSRLEARGTLRLVLKHAGLDPSSVSSQQMVVVVERLLAGALTKRKVDGAEPLCGTLAEDLRRWAANAPQPQADTAYDVFERLDSDRARRPKQ